MSILEIGTGGVPYSSLVSMSASVSAPKFYAECGEGLLEGGSVVLFENVVEQVIVGCLALSFGENHGVGGGWLNLNLFLEIT
jgi:hypothetical protein